MPLARVTTLIDDQAAEIRDRPLGGSYLNVGCGSVFDSRWTNVDLVSPSPHVMPWDIRQGLPFASESFDALYHSHVLEHLHPDDAEAFIAECVRVLKPGGVLRVVVPDLEQITRVYLQKLDGALADPEAELDHDWMMLELFDQMVRVRSGGKMGEWLRSQPIPNERFVRSRIGDAAVDAVRETDAYRRNLDSALASSQIRRMARPIVRSARAVARALRRTLLRVLAGKKTVAALDEARFRQQGESHRWMYDRVSLRRLLSDSGLTGYTVQDAFTSAIPRFTDSALDVREGKPRKPDSLFVEARKPNPIPDGGSLA